MKSKIMNAMFTVILSAGMCLLTSCDHDPVTNVECQSDMECLTKNTEKVWKLDAFHDVSKSEWNDCMVDLVMTIEDDGRWSYTCPGNPISAGKWWFSDDGKIFYTSPALTAFWHGDADTLAYEIVSISDNSFAYIATIIKPPYGDGVERYKRN